MRKVVTVMVLLIHGCKSEHQILQLDSNLLQDHVIHIYDSTSCLFETKVIPALLNHENFEPWMGEYLGKSIVINPCDSIPRKTSTSTM